MYTPLTIIKVDGQSRVHNYIFNGNYNFSLVVLSYFLFRDTPDSVDVVPNENIWVSEHDFSSTRVRFISYMLSSIETHYLPAGRFVFSLRRVKSTRTGNCSQRIDRFMNLFDFFKMSVFEKFIRD